MAVYQNRWQLLLDHGLFKKPVLQTGSWSLRKEGALSAKACGVWFGRSWPGGEDKTGGSPPTRRWRWHWAGADSEIARRAGGNTGERSGARGIQTAFDPRRRTDVNGAPPRPLGRRDPRAPLSCRVVFSFSQRGRAWLYRAPVTALIVTYRMDDLMMIPPLRVCGHAVHAR